MKKDIHPKYFNNVKVTCSSCSTTYEVGSTLENMNTELCSNCHPFYTGVEKIVDTDNLVAKFKERQSKAKPSFQSKRAKMASRKGKDSSTKKENKSVTLKDMLSAIDKK
jgi:large subunit ribosomal protein L31